MILRIPCLDPIRARSRSVPHTLPGVTGVDHIGFTVPDLEQARSFLVGVLGCEYLYSLGPFAHAEPADNWMAEHLDVDPRAVMRRLHFFRLGGQAIFEVFQYEAPDQRTVRPRNSDIGGHHVALYVEDMDAAVAFLRERGLTVLGDPTVSKGASEGQRWVYFLSPWGMQFELVSYPGRKAFDRAGGTAAAWAAYTTAVDPAGPAS
jgi:glyoxylase I family protein